MSRDENVRSGIVDIAISCIDKALVERNPTVITYNGHRYVQTIAYLLGNHKYGLTEKERQAVAEAYLISGWGEVSISSEFSTEKMEGGDSHCLIIRIELYTSTKSDFIRAKDEVGRSVEQAEQLEKQEFVPWWRAIIRFLTSSRF